MCTLGFHTCYCGVQYKCDDPNWLCPTVNEDEEACMCPKCMDEMVQAMESWYRDEGADEK